MKKLFCLVFTALMLLSLVACGKNVEAKWQEQYDLGVRYLSEGNYEEAIIAFTAAIEIEPKRAEAYRGLADVYYAMGEPEKAEEILAQIPEQEGDEDEAELPSGPYTERVDYPEGIYRVDEYDAAGNLVHLTWYDVNDEKNSEKSFEYDSDGNLLNMEYTNHSDKYREFYNTASCSYAFQYDSSGVCVRRTCYNSDGTVAWEYSNEYSASEEPDEEEEVTTNNEDSQKTSEEFDAAGNLVRKLIYDENGEVAREITYEYDELGRCVDEVLTFAGGTSGWHTTYEYSPSGKAVQRKHYVDEEGNFGGGLFYVVEYNAQGKAVRYLILDYTVGNDTWVEEAEYDAYGNYLCTTLCFVLNSKTVWQ